MARPKKPENAETAKVPETTAFDTPDIVPNGAYFGLIQMPQDLLPAPAAQRIVQWVNRDGKLSVYVSENAYQRIEAITWLDKLIRLSHQGSLAKGAAALFPIKGRIHWLRFTKDFCNTTKGKRVSPETDLEEVVG